MKVDGLIFQMNPALKDLVKGRHKLQKMLTLHFVHSLAGWRNAINISGKKAISLSVRHCAHAHKSRNGQTAKDFCRLACEFELDQVKRKYDQT